ncbi:hypothetical protein YPPY36_3690, partial [Yersinia pestis PY-36]
MQGGEGRPDAIGFLVASSNLTLAL